MIGPKPSSSKKTTSKKRSTRKPKVVEHPLSSEKLFTNREVGWLHFNRRVLTEAEDARNPLLERLRFLSISSSNMDEFFMKRVGGLKRQVAYGISPKSADGQTPSQQLATIRQIVIPTVQEQDRCFEKNLKPALAENSIFLLKWADLTAKEKELVKKYYQRNVFPVLTPLSVDPGHPFPFISNLSTSLGVTLKHPERDEKLFARVKIPKVLPQWIRVNPEAVTYRFVSLVEVIRENLADLFPSMQVIGAMAFRLTRNADSEHDQEDTEDLLETIEEELRQRRFAEVVRLEHGPNPDPWMIEFLMSELELAEEYIYELRGELDYTDLNMIYDLDLPKLKYEPWTPLVPPALTVEDASGFFSAIKAQDHLLHHPYESFSSTVEKFIRFASEDPKVLAIKMTLYRTGDNSPFIKSLIRAAEAGKQVVCLVELKARFDEERNIYWAQELENAGVHVVYGVVGLKTHAKTSLVVRQEAEGLRCYCHIGTGNYNVTTSRFYTDLGLLTAREEITNEVVEFFHYLTGRSLKNSYDKLLVAPVNMFPRFKAMIEREGEHAKAGRPSQIIAKFNNMEENDIAMSLYQASQKGTEVDLIVRGFCCMRPRVPGLSDRVRVTSIIGRFLEHSRIFYFRNGAQDPLDGDFYMGSADWMYRNLHARVEAIVPILDRGLKEKIWEILQLSLKDQRQTWQMTADGDYTQRKASNEVGVQQVLMQLTKQRVKNIEESASSSDS
ncbi:polyphosphate kinase 1 [Bdellovibrio sp. HCB337]|uniref:polyphosphate kinase 1 n=1 Tax=Bdellovibrio sp. HCB337 TaxID=3394358 RepID=UPI0039A53B39